MSRRTALGALLAACCMVVLPAAAGEAPQRILVFGDSQAQGLAGGVLRMFRGDREHKVLDRSKISTGLVPRANYDWPAQARTLAGTDPADVAIALFGANDRPPVRIGGFVDGDLLRRFADSYGSRVSDIAHAFRGNGTPLVWVGHPIVRDAAFAEDMSLLNEIFAARSVAEGATFVSTWDTFKGPDGGYSPYGRGTDGQTTRLRADDGVHLTAAGYDVMTAMLLPFIDRFRRGQPQVAVPPGRAAG